ncbi:hypothetical protein FOZ62_000543 [Perkinsus olseni]|uniref:Uncharacterized protein n=1 Tax=Perkinsus olseni TaxID=32597 RepID=A0A7J6SSF4_PEROL|nr:hypothetical protein FOZ62_000543 [Perkinsus olseni]
MTSILRTCTMALVVVTVQGKMMMRATAGHWKHDATDAFPPLYKARIGLTDNRAYCIYGDGLAERTRQLTVAVGKDSPARTTEIICPTSFNHREPFKSEFHNGYVRKTGRGEGDFVRTFTKDPVKSLDVTSLKKNLKEFHAGVLAGSKHLNRYSDSHPRDKSIDGERLKEMGKKGASAVKELNNLCSALREVLLNEYHSFANVCEVHRQTAEHVKKGSWVLLQ